MGNKKSGKLQMKKIKGVKIDEGKNERINEKERRERERIGEER